MKINEDTVGQIKLDVTRTVPAVEDPVFVERLTRVLTAYSIRNPTLGYPSLLLPFTVLLVSFTCT